MFSDFFKRDGTLRRISKLKPWPLKDVLIEKYEWSDEEAESFASFLLPMLLADPARRATAAQSLLNPWLTQDPNNSTIIVNVSNKFQYVLQQIKEDYYTTTLSRSLINTILGTPDYLQEPILGSSTGRNL